MTAQCEGMGEVGSARYEPALLPPCQSIRVLCYSILLRDPLKPADGPGSVSVKEDFLIYNYHNALMLLSSQRLHFIINIMQTNTIPILLIPYCSIFCYLENKMWELNIKINCSLVTTDNYVHDNVCNMLK